MFVAPEPFFHNALRFSIDPELRKIQSNDLIVYDVELSEYISRKLIRLKHESLEPLFTKADVDRIYDILAKANISDPIIKAEHIENIKIERALLKKNYQRN